MSIDPELATLLSHPGTPEGIKQALNAQSGSKFFKCAFQVNPFEYSKRHNKPNGFTSEREYNDAMATACRANGIEVVAITDHFRVADSRSLSARLEAEGVAVLPGFEANTSEGIHVLCLFPPGTEQSALEKAIGACDVRDEDAPSPQSKKGYEDLCRVIRERGGITICAHVTQKNGLLFTQQGQTRANLWKSSETLAAAIPGSVSDLPPKYKQICENKNPDYKRANPVALINAPDVSKPSDFALPSATTNVKMSQVSIEGLRQAFLDPESRIALNSDEEMPDHPRIVALAWEGGLLDGQFVHLNRGLNVLIGGRGAGKSTIIETVRYAFDIRPQGGEAERIHHAMMKALLGGRSRVSALVFTPEPSPAYYLVQRASGERPVVKSADGEISDLAPSSVFPMLTVFGQHEISEITRDKTILAVIIGRFVGKDSSLDRTGKSIKADLKTSRREIESKLSDIEQLEEKVSGLPELREKLKRFEKSGIKDKTSEAMALQKEERLIERVGVLIGQGENVASDLASEAAKVQPLFGESEGEKLPNESVLRELEGVVDRVKNSLAGAAELIENAMKDARDNLGRINSAWEPLKAGIELRYEEAKQGLIAQGFNPDDYLSVNRQIDSRLDDEKNLSELRKQLDELITNRKALIDQWKTADMDAHRELEKAARKVSRKLEGKVRAAIRARRSIEALEAVFKKHLSGNYSHALSRLKEKDDLSPAQLADDIRAGADTLVSEYGFSENSARIIASGGEKMALEIEETRLEPEAVIELNVGRPGKENWKELDQLSAGQKATAVLLLLLLENDGPLIVDQPEDDLDNSFITETVVPIMRRSKKRRQFLFSSHNPNIPVLGDGDQIVGLSPCVEGGQDRVLIEPEKSGSIDKEEVQQLIKDLLEGGERAFELRRTKYGY